jgi:signal transduction histidine kinase/PAS domain-containing protein
MTDNHATQQIEKTLDTVEESLDLHVLIVEPDITAAEIARTYLENLGCPSPQIVTSIQETLEVLSDQTPDLILMNARFYLDYASDGDTSSIFPRICSPIIYVTDRLSSVATVQTSVHNGFSYLVRPFGEQELRSVTFANLAARTLIGLGDDVAVGSSLSQVIGLVYQGVTVPHEALKRNVLTRGNGLDLSCHTLIVTDGSRLPIDGRLDPIKVETGETVGAILVFEDISERWQAESAVRRRNRELELINRLGKGFSSSLDLGQVIRNVLGEVRHLLNASGCSAWLIDDETAELVCRHANGPEGHTVRNWRLRVGQGLAGWVAAQGTSLVVGDTLLDNRHFKGVDADTGLVTRSVLSVPLKVREEVIGVLQVVDTRPNHLTEKDLPLVEAVASEAAIAVQNARLHALNEQLAVQEERHRLARDLHDTVTQSLYGIGLTAQSAFKVLSKSGIDEVDLQPIKHIHELARDTLVEMRGHLYDLRPDALSQKGLVTALSHHCDMLRGQYSISINFSAERDLTFTQEVQEVIFNIARESLWNIIRHAGASRVKVLLFRDRSHIELSVEDNGTGFDPTLVTSRGQGMSNMAERAKSVDGTFDICSEPGRGTRLRVRIPIGESD